ncbi:aquaporin [Luteipulveratus flavus]|uniref:Aquaporin n=1 Tax=Luteipulveratus flavus TaxID=3031728 RepID=A0ABT6C3K0_9MICO|nr:aquaporin [Luteipulveratus sp. YIM 133296]MDF8262644.1 aquaporin [Luteipulveratus sp. YIM 133296]
MTALHRRLVAEAVGTGVLVAAVIGSGIAATRLSPGDVGLQLLQNSLATGAVLVALILALQPVSAAFNPVVTLLDRVTGAIDTPAAIGLIGAQVLGGAAGALVANLMFDLPAVSIAAHHRATGGHLLGEVVATAGLVLVIGGATRGGRGDKVAYAVAGYIVGAYWFTSSTSFANPAVTIARTLTDTFAGISPASVVPYVLAQLVGGAAALGLLSVLYPTRTPAGESAAAQTVAEETVA